MVTNAIEKCPGVNPIENDWHLYEIEPREDNGKICKYKRKALKAYSENVLEMLQLC